MKVDSTIEPNPSPTRLQGVVNKILKALRAGIEFGSPVGGNININGAWATGVTPGVADQEFLVTHNLGRIPAGFFTASVDQNAAVLYKGVTAWTTKQISVKCHQTAVNYTIFVI